MALLDERLGFMYGYALELSSRTLRARDFAHCAKLLCEHFGERSDFEVGFIQDLELPTRLNADHRLPVPLPKPDDFPSINYLTNEELSVELAKLEPLVANTRDKQLQEYQEDFVSCLRGARKSGHDLVTFTS